MTQPVAYSVETTAGAARKLWSAIAIMAVGIAVAPLWIDRAGLHLLMEFAYMLTLAQMWNLVAGYGGMVSIGHQGFIGLGGYALFVFAMHFGGNPFVGVLVAGMAAACVSLVVAPVIFRLRNAYFAIGTWVVAEVFRLLVANSPSLGGGSGASLTSALAGYPAALRDATMFWIAAALGLGSTLAVYLLLRSRLGVGLTALRDDEMASESLGVRVRSMRLAVFVASAAGCGLAGGLIYLVQLRISPDAAFSVEWSAAMIFIVVIGGIGTIEGPVIGTVLYLLLRALLADYGSWYLITLGTLGILTMLLAPRGLWGMLASRFDWRLFPVRRRVRRVDATAAARRSDAGRVAAERRD